MYDFAFKEVGLRLPFTNLQQSVFNWLQLSPSQLHPNAFAFLQAFKIVYIYLDVEPTLPSLLRVFHLHRLREIDEKYN